MSVVRIDNPAGRTHGWQARAHVAKGLPRLTRFFADSSHGGKRAAKAAAARAEAQLQRKARRLQKAVSA